MDDGVFESFLRRQQEEGMRLVAESDIVSLTPLDGPPAQHYIASFRAKGLVKSADGEVVEATGFDAGIAFTDDYLRRVEVPRVLTYLGPHRRPWHPNVLPPFICIHVRPGMPLTDLLYACFELWTWTLYNTGDEGLNHGAAQWARHQPPQRFPIDRRPLKRRNISLTLRPAGKG